MDVLKHPTNDQEGFAMSPFSQSIDRPPRAAGTAAGDAPSKPDSAIASILLDVVIPLGIYYLLHDAFGLSLVTSMACSSVLPAVRTIVTAVRDHTLETLAALMLTMNLASIVVSLASGDVSFDAANEVDSGQLQKGITDLGYTVVKEDAAATGAGSAARWTTASTPL